MAEGGKDNLECDRIVERLISEDKGKLPKTLKNLKKFVLNVVNEIKEIDSKRHNPEPIQPSSIKENFDILDILGKGNYGKVYKAQNKYDSRIFAIKEIVVKQGKSKEIENALTEIENLSKLKPNQNIVKYFDSFRVDGKPDDDDSNYGSTEEMSSDEYSTSSRGQKEKKEISLKSSDSVDFRTSSQNERGDDHEYEMNEFMKSLIGTPSTFYIKMEYCDSTLEKLMNIMMEHRDQYSDVSTLFKNMMNLPIPFSFRPAFKNESFGLYCPIFILLQICKGLKFIHSSHIIHRDLKPENIFITNDGYIKIGDFGLSADISSLKLSSIHGAGTRFYAAPENLEPNSPKLAKDLLPKADMFSLGMIAFKMIGFLHYGESELYRFNDNIRKHHPLEELFVAEDLYAVAQGTCQLVIPFVKDPWENILAEIIKIIGVLLHQHPINRPSSYNLIKRIKNFLANIHFPRL